MNTEQMCTSVKADSHKTASPITSIYQDLLTPNEHMEYLLPFHIGNANHYNRSLKEMHSWCLIQEAVEIKHTDLQFSNCFMHEMAAQYIGYEIHPLLKFG